MYTYSQAPVVVVLSTEDTDASSAHRNGGGSIYLLKENTLKGLASQPFERRHFGAPVSIEYFIPAHV
jgi:hypothetical protein